MEQTVSNTDRLQATSSPLLSAQESKFRSLIFSVLKPLEDAHVELIEGDKVWNFGDESSDLSACFVVYDTSCYKDIALGGSIGAAEAYIDGKWSSPDLTKVIQIMARNQRQLDALDSKVQWLTRAKHWFLRKQNANTEAGSKRNILAHYDIGNELYTRFLDPSMQYSSAIYSEDALDLSAAQQNKMETICQRLSLKETDHVVEIGTGWGGLATYMAKNYGCRVTTTTISDAQHEYAEKEVKRLGLESKVTLLKKDYRALTGQYDKLVSIEMIEAVGHEFLENFFAKCSSLLKPSGKMLIQSITIADARYDKYRKGVDFIQKYIFPGGCLPSIAVMSGHIAKQTDMVIHQIDDIGLHYARTLNDWKVNFLSRWTEINRLGYSEEFKRLWLFYFCYCEGAFLERVISTHHIVARKPQYRGQEDEMVLDY